MSNSWSIAWCKGLFLIPFTILRLLSRRAPLFSILSLHLIFNVEARLRKHDICLLIKDKILIVVNSHVFVRKLLVLAVWVAAATYLPLYKPFLVLFGLALVLFLVTALIVFCRKKNKNDQWELKRDEDKDATQGIICVSNDGPNSK